MYIVTFYSYKGGVGRTLALVNVAFELVQRSKRVLLVDFDLEAPGIPSFQFCKAAGPSLGLVDYISDFLRESAAPDVAAYVHKSTVENLWVMSAGSGKEAYGSRLGMIDWQELYIRHSGFLMFEDMKQQWQRTIRPDYVLIDSRTGYNDIGGICTRQLPDAVVQFFVLNDQNIEGTSQITREIRDESIKMKKTIDILFVPSRLPKLDDEQEILAEKLRVSKELIGYSKPAATIYNYDSLSLLNQEIFTKYRPKTQLAKEYRDLADAIVSRNIQDAEGAAKYLEQLRARVKNGKGIERKLTDDDERKIIDVLTKHSASAKILELTADIRVYSRLYEEAHDMLSLAIEQTPASPELRLKRALIRRTLSNESGAVEDLDLVLSQSDSGATEIYFAMTELSEIAPERLVERFSLRLVDSLPIERKIALVRDISTSVRSLTVSERVLSDVLAHVDNLKPDDQQYLPDAQRAMMVTLIGQGRFKEAIALANTIPAKELDISWHFNRAMALWGLDGAPKPENFRPVTELAETVSDSGANFHLCLAIAFGVVSEPERAHHHANLSEKDIKRNRRPVFSPWRYLTVPPQEFLKDVMRVRQFIDGVSAPPVYMSEPQLLPLT